MSIYKTDRLQKTYKFLQKDKKIGIAFSGGGAKGFVHIGVVKALQEYGLEFDCIAGTSVGSIVGAFYANGYSWEEMQKIGNNIQISDIKTSKIFPSKTIGLQNIITKEMGDINIEDLKTPFYAVSVDIKSLKECDINTGNLAKACAGSCAIPGVFNPVKFEDKLLCDGGLKNSMPADVLRKNGCDFVISIDIGGNRENGVKSTKLLEVLTCALQILIKDTSYKGYLNSDYVIQPNVNAFSFRKKQKVQEMIDEGYRATIEAMPEILKVFEKKRRRSMNFLADNLQDSKNTKPNIEIITQQETELIR